MSNFLVLITGGIFFLLSLYIFYKSRKSTAAAQLKLKENENFNSIINLANDAMLVIDIVDGRIHQVNPAACDLLGYSEKQLLGKTLFQLHPEEDLQRSSSVVADTWERGGLIYDDIPFLHASGGRVAVECSARVAPFAGRPAIVIYARDIRERLRLEAEIAEQRRLIDEKSKDIHDSIEYSRRIQRSFLLDEKEIRFHQNEGFIFFQPRESVSGDFYWFINYVLNRQIISESGTVYEPGSRILAVAAVDCTGHGVPGAFISMIGNTLLEQTIRNENFRSPAAVLDHVNAGLKKHLNKNNDGSPLRDGMDMALCCIDFDGLQLEFAGANNPCYLIRNGNLMVLSAESQALTASTDIPVKPFSNQKVKLEKGDCLYLFSDGYADQFGGPRGKKFMSKKFKEYLLEIHLQPMDLQKTLLKETFEKWKGDLDQTDDVLVIGVRV
jgi:PAS domain S-box-containing protein